MADDPKVLSKRVAISKANAQMVGVVAAASFIAVFALVASKAVFSQVRYQARVTSVKETAHRQLEKNIKAYNDLASAFGSFDTNDPNVIGGTKDGPGDNDGSNAKIILDALPPVYDFPALTSSVEKVVNDNGLKLTSITGTDDQLNQQSNTSSPTPVPVPIPFSFTIDGANYANVNQLIARLEHSIRPFQMDTIHITGGNNSMTLTLNAHTYYQPIKDVQITKKVVK
jgi:hypothetical protein